jgi:hypothetical protein
MSQMRNVLQRPTVPETIRRVCALPSLVSWAAAGSASPPDVVSRPRQFHPAPIERCWQRCRCPDGASGLGSALATRVSQETHAIAIASISGQSRCPLRSRPSHDPGIIFCSRRATD